MLDSVLHLRGWHRRRHGSRHHREKGTGQRRQRRAALSHYTVSVAKAVARYNVTVNNLLPGMHHTATAGERFGQMAEDRGTTYDQEVQDWINEWRIPADTFGNIDDFGALCALYCSLQANYIVGQNLVVDGGVTNSTF